ncbi:MAG: PepSY-like domain-containing protein [Phycisphaerales bacterium]|nr:PepSY-like domain-containing protein [Phycisphaerales bacterium]
MFITGKALITAALLATAAGATIGITNLDRTDDKAVTLDQVPRAVRVAILSRLDGGTITELERTTDHGRVLYEVDVRTANGVVEFDIAEDGTFAGYDNDAGEDDDDGEDDGDVAVRLDHVPDAVREMIVATLHGGRIIEIERTTDHGRVLYEVDVLTEFDIAEDGTFVGYDNDTDDGDDDENEVEVTIDQVPDAVRETINATLNGGAIEEIEMSTSPDGVVVYEVEIEHENSEDIEFVVAENGTFLGVEMDDEDHDDDENEDEDDD